MKRTGFVRKIPAPVSLEQRQKPQKKCAVKTCRALFTPRTITHKACSPECALIIAEDVRKRKERKEYKERKEKLKSRTSYAEEAQEVFNRYINLRDKNKPCISCDKPAHKGVRNASHYKSRGAYSALRFNLWNTNTSCYSCNFEKAGNIGEYRPRLIKKIGIEKVEFLENHPRSRIYDKDYLIRLKNIFSRKIKRLKSRIE